MSAAKHNKFSTRAVKVALLDRGLTVSELARKMNRPRPTVSAALNGNTRFPRVQQAIMEVIFS